MLTLQTIPEGIKDSVEGPPDMDSIKDSIVEDQDSFDEDSVWVTTEEFTSPNEPSSWGGWLTVVKTWCEH